MFIALLWYLTQLDARSAGYLAIIARHKHTDLYTYLENFFCDLLMREKFTGTLGPNELEPNSDDTFLI